MKIATWNLNSIRARLPRLLAALDRHQPDLLCVQETKSMDDKFPHEELAAAGYVAVTHGQKTYNGVAFIMKSGAGELEDVRHGFDGNPIPEQARVISAKFNGIQIVNAYIVNGKEVGDPKFEMKMEWDLDQLFSYLQTWSAVRQYLQKDGDEEFLTRSYEALKSMWGDGKEKKSILMDFTLLVGRNIFY